MNYRERRYTAQDGLSLYFRDYGDAAWETAPVLCLPGLTRNSGDFDGIASRLARRRRVVCPDYRGRGRSDADPNWRNYVPRTYVNDIVHLLAAANLHHVVVIGTSLGGLLAMALGAAAPSALAGVILNDIGPDVEGEAVRGIVEYIGEDRPQPDWDTAVATLKRLLPNARFQDQAAWDLLTRNTFRAGEDGLLHFDWDLAIVKPVLSGASPVPDMWPLFRALAHVPVLALRGEVSDILSPACFDRMAEVRPDLVRVVVRDTGHAPTLDEPECRKAIDDFLGDL